MEKLKNLLEIQVGSQPTNEKSINQILGAIYTGRATAEDKQYYIDNYMSEEEKKIGKPYFEMSKEEEQQYKVLCYNNKQGDLKGYDCPKCMNRGDFIAIKDGYETYINCSCMAIRKTIKRMEESGLGNLLSIYKFNTYECNKDWQKEIYDKAKTFIDSEKNWFCMLGESGSGKTHICTAISRELLKRGMGLKYMMWVDDSTILHQNKMNAEIYNPMIEELKNIQVLYIDDLFKTKDNTDPTAADIKLAYEILNYRYNKARMDKSQRYITIISSEKTWSQLLSYDKATAGRIAEMTKPNNLIMISGEEKNYRLN